ncbi:MAG: hypothetical protein HY746_04385 [Elusimicrobia bacterium]|nr:hypothetical protein [Elusimicrobiota bacterium]
MKLEIKNVQISSLILSSLPAVIFVVGLLGGFVTFVINPSSMVTPMSLPQKFLSIGLYSLIYMVLVAAIMVLVAFVYNIFTNVLGLRGVRIETEEFAE